MVTAGSHNTRFIAYSFLGEDLSVDSYVGRYIGLLPLWFSSPFSKKKKKKIKHDLLIDIYL